MKRQRSPTARLAIGLKIGDEVLADGVVRSVRAINEVTRVATLDDGSTWLIEELVAK